jgi:hypothetical protein
MNGKILGSVTDIKTLGISSESYFEEFKLASSGMKTASKNRILRW